MPPEGQHISARGDNPIVVGPTDARLAWLGVAELRRLPHGAQPVRLPAELAPLLPSPHRSGQLQRRAEQTAGVRLRLRTDSDTVGLRVAVDTSEPNRPDPADPEPVFDRFDLCVDGRLIDSARPDGSGRVSLATGGRGTKTVDIWLPHVAAVVVSAVAIDADAVLDVAPVDHSGGRWLVYGSSISQCAAARSPTRTWPARVALTIDLDLRCLGLGGSCLLESVVARHIRDSTADAMLFELGINIYGTGAFALASLQAAVIGFVRTVREGHERTPIVIVSPIASPARESVPGPGRLTLADIRTQIEHAVDRLATHGDHQLQYVDGRELLGPDDADRLFDGLHPDDEGYRIIAERVLRLGLVG